MTPLKPKISIITPTYNREHLLSRMVQSVLNQSFLEWELIIVDDGSTDNTGKLVNGINDPRIKYYYTTNSGAADSRNSGVGFSVADFIIFLDSDDESKPNWLESLYNELILKNASIVCCGYEKLNSNNEMFEVVMPQKLGPIFEDVVGSFLSGTMLIRKKLFLESGGFDTNLPSMQHTELFMRLFPIIKEKNVSIVNIFESLVKVYIHRGKRIRYDLEAIYQGNIVTLKKHQNLFLKNKNLHFDYLSVAGVSAIKTHRTSEGLNLLIKALKVNPFAISSYLRVIVGFTPWLRKYIWKVKK